MKKQMLALLLIMSPIFIQVMENNSSFLPATELISPHQTRRKSYLSNIRADKKEIERQLQLYGKSLNMGLNTVIMEIKPILFLKYCYWHYKNAVIKYLDESDNALRETCQNTHINGCSALGTAIISVCKSNKRNFIQELLNHDFKLTPKDIALAKLVLYDEITEYKTLVHILYSQANWSVLPQDVKRIIIQNMIQLLTNELWLLPEES